MDTNQGFLVTHLGPGMKWDIYCGTEDAVRTAVARLASSLQDSHGSDWERTTSTITDRASGGSVTFEYVDTPVGLFPSLVDSSSDL